MFSADSISSARAGAEDPETLNLKDGPQAHEKFKRLTTANHARLGPSLFRGARTTQFSVNMYYPAGVRDQDDDD